MEPPPLESFDIEDDHSQSIEKEIQDLKDYMGVQYKIIYRLYHDVKYQELKRKDPQKAKNCLYAEFKTFALTFPARFRQLQKEKPDPKMLVAFYEAQLKNIKTPDVGKYGTNKTEFAQTLARRYMKEFLKEGETPI